MYIIYTSSQKTQHQKLNSYWVMNSLGGKICPPAAPSINKYKYKSYAVLIKNGLKMNSYRNGIHQLILLLHLYCIDISSQPLVMRTI